MTSHQKRLSNSKYHDPNYCDNCALGHCRAGLGDGKIQICNEIWCKCECKGMAKIKEVQF